MSLLVVEDATLFFADRMIFDSVSLRLSQHDRIGLIGPNGSGKTTFLKVLAGHQELDDGKVTVTRGTRIGWLPQDLAIGGGRTLLGMILEGVPGRAELQDRLARVSAELDAAQAEAADEAVLLELVEEVGEVHERLDHFERFFGEHEALAILAGLGFAPGDEHRDIGEFSGGWKMRAVLAGLLFQRPDVLLLDEPTNHLDMPSVAWFSDFLKRWNRCVMLISHDREFLNEQINRVVSLEPEGVRTYTGNYERYLVLRAEEAQVLQGKARNLGRERERLQRFVDRFRAQANKARAVQSRIKALEKMEQVETYDQRKVMHFTFPATTRPVAEVIKVEGLRKAYGEHVVFGGLDLTVKRGDKIGIIGVNGAGKTTLLRMLAGEIPSDGGTIKLGGGVNLGYYAQHHADTLDMTSTIYDVVLRQNPLAPPARIRAILGGFMFSGDDIDKPVKVLSGGERARVALARLLVAPGNVLIMDEPTNHLDLDSSVSLCAALRDYDGTLIFVTHNRAFVRGLAAKIWNVEGGRVDEYPGALDEYLYAMAQRHLAVAATGAPGLGNPKGGTGRDLEPVRPVSREDDKARKRREAEVRKLRSQKLGPIEKRIAELERRITDHEQAQAKVSAELADPAVYEDDKRRRTLLAEFQTNADKLEELTARWESAQHELAAASAEFAEG